jgi:hypothetical protein
VVDALADALENAVAEGSVANGAAAGLFMDRFVMMVGGGHQFVVAGEKFRDGDQ